MEVFVQGNDIISLIFLKGPLVVPVLRMDFMGDEGEIRDRLGGFCYGSGDR